MLRTIGPFVLEWAIKYVRKELTDLKEKIEEDKKRDVVNAANLKAYNECKDLEACIIQAKNTFNGTTSNKL